MAEQHSKKSDSTTEEGIAAASYVLTFYREVLLLTHWKSMWKNMLVEIRYKYSDDKLDKLDDTEKSSLRDMVQNLRYYCDKTQTLYFAIIENLALTKAEENGVGKIKEAMKTIEENYVIDRAVLDDFVKELHKFLLKDVVKGLLKTSQDIIDSVYGKE